MSIPQPSPQLPVLDLVDSAENGGLEQSQRDDVQVEDSTKVENNVIVADQEPTTSGPPSDQVHFHPTSSNTIHPLTIDSPWNPRPHPHY
jgi:hypothetical protein